MPVRKIKKSLLKRQISKTGKAFPHVPVIQPWDQVKTIGLLCLIENEADYKKLNQIILKLRTEHKTVRALCLFSGKELPSYCKILEEYDYVNKKDLNWYGKPKGNIMSRFFEHCFDILINLDLTQNRSFDFIINRSQAKLKAGLRRKETDGFYDLMIDNDLENEQESLLDLIVEWVKKLCPTKS